ncbi:hypothetical protein C8N36_114109 [Pelagimonas varians]|uniref:Uncharacterized protein n=2 Tax=Pelagimonas varians TaxID=696760 RepID=A0A238KY78_9RHOB|nr:hypothetical protein C8N36_114109 [Pelagimonas varians]SMX47677.1 hypothetical protein PEV8663_03608 [Pelagimonas varians]
MVNGTPILGSDDVVWAEIAGLNSTETTTAAAAVAQKWAHDAENTEVEAGAYSARHHAAKSQASAQGAGLFQAGAMADAAAASVDRSGAQASALTATVQAAQSANAASMALAAALASGLGVYGDTAAGLAATGDGGQFVVVDDAGAHVYANVGDVATDEDGSLDQGSRRMQHSLPRRLQTLVRRERGSRVVGGRTWSQRLLQQTTI